MKKYAILVLCLLFSTFLLARNDIDLSTFNKHMMENMDEVIEHNPEIYEKESKGRKPASVETEKPSEKYDPKKATEKLDIHEYQTDGGDSW